MKKSLIFVSILFLAACGGGGDSGSKAPEKTIVGVWDGTEDMGQEGKDESYLVIDANRSMSFYDYDGDSYDQGDNCYWIFKNFATLVSLGNDRYTLDPVDAEEASSVIKLVVAGDSMTATDEESDEAVVMKRTTRQVSDFTPECDTSVGRTQALLRATEKAKVSLTKRAAAL
jgi:hypothetical protein